MIINHDAHAHLTKKEKKIIKTKTKKFQRLPTEYFGIGPVGFTKKINSSKINDCSYMLYINI